MRLTVAKSFPATSGEWLDVTGGGFRTGSYIIALRVDRPDGQADLYGGFTRALR